MTDSSSALRGLIEHVAREIYWAAYDQYIDETYRHPLGFTKEVAWVKTSEAQRGFCTNQARRAIEAIKARAQ